MSEQVSGKVTKIFKTNGKAVFYKIRIEGDNRWFSLGQTKPLFSEGAVVTFQYNISQNGQYTNYNVVTSTLLIVETSVPKSYSSTGPVSKDDYWANKEAKDGDRDLTISYAAARNAAIEVVTAALQHDLLPFKGKKQDHFDQYVEAIKQQTVDFFREVTNIAQLKEYLKDTGEYNAESSFIDGSNFEDD